LQSVVPLTQDPVADILELLIIIDVDVILDIEIVRILGDLKVGGMCGGPLTQSVVMNWRKWRKVESHRQGGWHKGTELVVTDWLANPDEL